MKYTLVRKKFKIGDIVEIPDNAVAICNNGFVHDHEEEIEEKFLGFKYKRTKMIWAYSFEWLEPIKKDFKL